MTARRRLAEGEAPMDRLTLWTRLALAAGLLVGGLALCGCGGKITIPWPPAGPGTCARPAPGPECPFGDPAGYCGCWTCSGRSGGEWRWTGECQPPPTTQPPAQPELCRLSGQPSTSLEGWPSTPALAEAVNSAIRAETGQDGGRIVVQASRQAFQAAIVARLQAAGWCAGQHAPDSDEIAVAASPGDPWEGYHVYAGPWDGPGTALLAPQAYRGAWAPVTVAPPHYPPPPPDPDPDPPVTTPSTTTPPPAPPQAAGCPAPSPSGLPGRLRCGPHAGGLIDCTPKAIDASYCMIVHGQPAGACDVRPEGHQDRMACESALGGGGYRIETRDGARCESWDGNPLQMMSYGPWRGGCRICAVDGSFCGEWF